MTQTIAYNSSQKQMIHQLLAELFDEAEFDQFCTANFQPVLEHFTPDLEYPAKIQLLIEYCADYKQLGHLVKFIQQSKPDAYQSFVQQIQGGAKRQTAPLAAAPAIPTASPPQQTIDQLKAALGQTLGERYQLAEILDTSGRGAVFKAYDAKTEIDVAIKVIQLDGLNQRALRERIREEARTVMQLDHPGIVQVYDFGETESLIYVIMEFIPGSNLHQVRQSFQAIDKQTALPQLVELMRQLGLTVDYMHQQGMLHPSLIPDNIMLKPANNDDGMAWQPVLINFALLRPQRETIHTQAELSTEQLTYQVSPELLLGNITDRRSDVYGLGILFYDLLLDQPPFKPGNLAEARHLHVELSPSPPRSVYPNLPEDIERIILKALSKNPRQRYQTAKEFAQALALYQENLAVPIPPPPTEGKIMIMVDTSRPLIVTPGASLSIKLTLRNQGAKEDYCQIRVQGAPPNWVSIKPSPIILPPGEIHEAQLMVRPPLSSLSRAGQYALTIEAISQYGLGQSNQVEQTLTIAPYIQFDSNIWPEEITPEQPLQITIENHSNTSEVFTVRPNPDESLIFEPEQIQIQIEPGDKAGVDFRVAPTSYHWIGKTFYQPISVQITAAQNSEATQTQPAQLITRGIISPLWIVIMVLSLAAVCCIFFTLYFTIIAPPPPPPPTATPIREATATPTTTLVPSMPGTLVPTLAPPPATPTPIPVSPTLVPTVAPVTIIPAVTSTLTPPRAIIYGPSNAQINEVITFDASGSQAGSSNIVGYTWQFGDGSNGNGASINHVYYTAGTYQVTLTVTDENNQSNITSLPIQVTE